MMCSWCVCNKNRLRSRLNTVLKHACSEQSKCERFEYRKRERKRKRETEAATEQCVVFVSVTLAQGYGNVCVCLCQIRGRYVQSFCLNIPSSSDCSVKQKIASGVCSGKIMENRCVLGRKFLPPIGIEPMTFGLWDQRDYQLRHGGWWFPKWATSLKPSSEIEQIIPPDFTSNWK